MTALALRAAVQLLGGYAMVIVALFLAAVLRGIRWQKRVRLSARLEPEIRDALVNYIAGSDDLTHIQELVAASRQDVAKGVLVMQAAVSGSARDRICGLALEIALIHDWREQTRARDPLRRREAYSAISLMSAFEPVRRVVGEYLENALDDPDREVRLCAAQALAQFGSKADVERVFQMAVHENLLARALLAGPLRIHCMDLCESVLPAALASEDERVVLGTLELVVAWERALPISGLYKLIDSENRDVRIQALRTVPLVLADSEDESAVRRALVESDPELAMAAAAAAGRRRMQSALPHLARCLRSGNSALARTAAGALLALPPKGQATLHELAESTDEITASAAQEALGRAQFGRGAE